MGTLLLLRTGAPQTWLNNYTSLAVGTSVYRDYTEVDDFDYGACPDLQIADAHNKDPFVNHGDRNPCGDDPAGYVKIKNQRYDVEGDDRRLSSWRRLFWN